MLKLTKQERIHRMLKIHGTNQPLIDHVDEILAINEQLVHARARHNSKFDKKGNDIHDFIQVGLISLQDCCTKFDRSMIANPNDLNEVQRVWQSYIYKQIDFYQRNVNRIRTHEVKHGMAISLDIATADDDPDTKLHDIIEDEGADGFTKLTCIDYPIVKALFHVLNERERVAITHLTGIDGSPILKKIEIAEIIGVTKADVKNQFDRGIRKLRAAINEQCNQPIIKVNA